MKAKVPDASFHEVTVTNFYDVNGNRVDMSDATGTNQYFRDGVGRVYEERGSTRDNTYTYDVAGNLTAIGGDTYSYDALERLTKIVDPTMGTFTYGYDAVGNLASITYPNGVVQSYHYDAKNRLNNLASVGGSGANATNLSWAYTVDNAGHRTSVTEASGRKVNYTYDNLYRLTNETIQSDPAGKSGSITYAYDQVGNRTLQTSTSPAITSGSFGYDADDRLTSDVYDANGNTVNTGGQGITYDFENHILTENGATYLYDGDGNRVEKSVGGLNTLYAIVTVNPTGYPQVGYEQYTGFGAHDAYRVWVLGLEREAQDRLFLANNQYQPEISYYVRDGHGSVRALTDPSGNVTDTYDYDAFGNLISSATYCPSSGIAESNAAACSSTVPAAPTPNAFLFAGEQYDAETGHYYNRARYLSTTTGRFMTMDTYQGATEDPASLHKYLYTEADPVDSVDPLGLYTPDFGRAVEAVVRTKYSCDFYSCDPQPSGVTYGQWARVGPPMRVAPYALKPDIFDRNRLVWADVKPLSISGIADASATWAWYDSSFTPYGYYPETKWVSSGRLITVNQQPVLIFNRGGIIFYTTSQADYNLFQEVLESAEGFSLAAVVGGGAGVLVNKLVSMLPQYPQGPSGGSEVVDINKEVQIATEGTEAEAELDVVTVE